MTPNPHGAALRQSDPEMAAIQQRRAARTLQRARPNFPTQYREVLVLREIEDMGYQEIATATHVPIGTVMSRLARARRHSESYGWVDRRRSTVHCPEESRLMAYFDWEVDALTGVEIERHIEAARIAASAIRG